MLDEKPMSRSSVAAIRFLFATGCRLGEALTLCWEDVELERGIARLRDDKASETGRVVLLNALALEALALTKGLSKQWCLSRWRARASPTCACTTFDIPPRARW